MADHDETKQPNLRDQAFERALGQPVSQRRDVPLTEVTPDAESSLHGITPLAKPRASVMESAKTFISRSGLAIQSLKQRGNVVRTAASERIIANVPRVTPQRVSADDAARTAAAQAAANATARTTTSGSVLLTGRTGESARTAYVAAPSGAAAATAPLQRRMHEPLFGTGTDSLIGLSAALFTLFVGGWILKDALFSRSMDKSGLQRIIAKKWNDRTLVFPIEGTDAQGRRALFDVVVLTKDYGWVKGSTTELERGQTRLSAEDIESEVLAPQLREGLGSSRELIAVGLASQEGEVEREEQRGGLRAARIAGWVKGAVDPNIPMWTLNLGRYLEPCAECEEGDTSWQRPFIVIAVRQTDPGTNVSEALKSAMSDKVNLPSPARYSAWAMSRFEK